MNEKIANYIAAEILKQPERLVDPEEKLISSGLIDSFHLVDLSIFIEENFDVVIEDTELNVDTFDTINQLADLIRQRQKGSL